MSLSPAGCKSPEKDALTLVRFSLATDCHYVGLPYAKRGYPVCGAACGRGVVFGCQYPDLNVESL